MSNMKFTPPCCSINHCASNALSPMNNSQECIGCPHLKDPKWIPRLRTPK